MKTKPQKFFLVGCWGLVLNPQNQVLLLKRKSFDFWESVGGTWENGETLEECIIREAQEEANIKIIVQKELFYEEIETRNHRFFAFCHQCLWDSGTVKNNEPEEFESIEWFNLDALPENISPYTQKAIDQRSTD